MSDERKELFCLTTSEVCAFFNKIMLFDFFFKQGRFISLLTTLFNSLSSLVVFINKNHRQHARERTQKEEEEDKWNRRPRHLRRRRTGSSPYL